LTSLAGRSEASHKRAQTAGADAVDDAKLVRESEIILSVVPPARAAEAAERFRSVIDREGARPVYVDCNAVAPGTVRGIAMPFSDAGMPFVDGSIIGAPPKDDTSSGPRLYLCGEAARAAALLASHGLDARDMARPIGDASALKMSYAGITKGFQALTTAMALGAARNGVSGALAEELEGGLPEIRAWLSRQLPKMPAKAYRWDGEMQEVAAFLAPERGSVAMLQGAVDLYRCIAAELRGGLRRRDRTGAGGLCRPGRLSGAHRGASQGERRRLRVLRRWRRSSRSVPRAYRVQVRNRRSRSVRGYSLLSRLSAAQGRQCKEPKCRDRRWFAS
jgi:3-hydroxyisobutyrate dehydrogenase-like beta-hydroxyacid dehydrogenase